MNPGMRSHRTVLGASLSAALRTGAGWSIGGGHGCVFARYDAAGTRVWIRQFGTSDSDWVSGLAPDGAGGVVITGPTSGTFAGPYTDRSMPIRPVRQRGEPRVDPADRHDLE